MTNFPFASPRSLNIEWRPLEKCWKAIDSQAQDTMYTSLVKKLELPFFPFLFLFLFLFLFFLNQFPFFSFPSPESMKREIVCDVVYTEEQVTLLKKAIDEYYYFQLILGFLLLLLLLMFFFFFFFFFIFFLFIELIVMEKQTSCHCGASLEPRMEMNRTLSISSTHTSTFTLNTTRIGSVLLPSLLAFFFSLWLFLHSFSFSFLFFSFLFFSFLFFSFLFFSFLFFAFSLFPLRLCTPMCLLQTLPILMRF